jgi:hypothetical protein
MSWTPRQPMAVKRGDANAFHVAVISSPPARGRASAPLPADCELIAGYRASTKTWRLLSNDHDESFDKNRECLSHMTKSWQRYGTTLIYIST